MANFFEINTEARDKVPFFLNTIGRSPSQSSITRPNGFNYHQFLVVKEGEGLFTVEENSFTASEGEGVFIRAGIPHSYEGAHFHTVWCSFLIDGKTLDYMGIGNYLKFKTPSSFETELNALLEFSNGQSTPVSRSAAGYSFVTEVFSDILSEADTPFDKIRRYLESRYSEPITLDEIADLVSMDKFALCRYYSATRGMTVMEELKNIRIAKAKRFLRYTSDSSEKIGKLCGFESPSYFCLKFREVCGYTPGEYRKKRSLS